MTDRWREQPDRAIASRALTDRQALLVQRFAERVVELAGPDKDKQIDWAFRLALGRPPSKSEAEKARAIDPARLGLVLFNLNEFLYLE